MAAKLEFGGDFKERVEGKQQRVAIKGVANLAYDEMTLEAGKDRLRSVRYYGKAESAVKFPDGTRSFVARRQPAIDGRARRSAGGDAVLACASR